MSVQGWPTNNQTLKMPGGLAVQEYSAYQVRPRVGRRIGRFLDTAATSHFKSRPFSGRRGGGEQSEDSQNVGRPRCSRFGRPPGPPESGPSKRKTLNLGGPALRCTARVFRCSAPPESGPKFRKTQQLGGFALEESSDFQARRLADRSFRRLNNAGWLCLEEPSEIQVRGLAGRNTGRR